MKQELFCFGLHWRGRLLFFHKRRNQLGRNQYGRESSSNRGTQKALTCFRIESLIPTAGIPETPVRAKLYVGFSMDVGAFNSRFHVWRGLSQFHLIPSSPYTTGLTVTLRAARRIPLVGISLLGF